MKLSLSFFILLFLITPVFSQKQYFITDSGRLVVGRKIIDGGDVMNSSYCQVKIKKGITRYSPYQVFEYGTNDGRKFFSKTVTEGDSSFRIFMEKIVSDSIRLYRCWISGEKTFFIERDSAYFHEIPKSDVSGNESYNAQLREISADCKNVQEAAGLVKYTTSGMKRFFREYNKCLFRPFPFIRYGITAGYESIKLMDQHGLLNDMDFHNDGGLIFGLFLDYPLFTSYFSVQSELYYSRHSFSYNIVTAEKDMDLTGSISSVKWPVLVKFSVPLHKNLMYVNAGFLSALNYKVEGYYYNSSIQGDQIEIQDKQEVSLVTKFQKGYCAGAGMAIRLDYRHYLTMEFRYEKLYSDGNDEELNVSAFEVKSGINF